MKGVCLVLFLCLLSLFTVSCSDDAVHEGMDSTISKELIEKFSKTTKIAVKLDIEDRLNLLGTITDGETIDEVVKLIASGEANSDAYFCDGNLFSFEMYDENGEKIDTIMVWSDGKRVMPESSYSGGCGYYTVAQDGLVLKRIIEENTVYKFFGIRDTSSSCDANIELVYEDKNRKYYFQCTKSDKVFVEFEISGLKMTVKRALEEGYVTPDELLSRVSTLFLIEHKE